MIEGPNNWYFWAAIAGATAFRVMTSRATTLGTVAVGAFGGIFCAIFFTDPLLAHFNASPDTYKAAVAALLTLTGEGMLRLMMAGAKDPIKIIELYRAWRGDKK